MRRIRCFEVPGASAQDVLNEFHEVRSQLNIQDNDIISINATPIAQPVNISGPEATGEAKVRVAIFYWSND